MSSQDRTEVQSCPRCDASLPGEFAYCGHCGHRIGSSADRSDTRYRADDVLAAVAALDRPASFREDATATLTAWCAEPTADGGWIVVRAEEEQDPGGLLAEVARRREPHVTLRVRATPDSQVRPYALARFIVLAIWRFLYGRASPQPHKRAVFAEALAKLGDAPAPYVDVLWALVQPGLTLDHDPSLDPVARRETTEAGLRTLIAAFAADTPGSIIVLDAYHYADSESAALLEKYAQRLGGPALPFLCVTAGDPGWQRPQRTLRLEPLDDADALAYLAAARGHPPLPAETAKAIVASASGSPLYLDEALRALEDAPAWADEAWPRDLDALMRRRADHLDEAARLFLGLCSVQGNVFALAAAEEVWNARAASRPDTQALLAKLPAGFIGPVHGNSESVLEFLRPAIRSCFYESLSDAQRRAFHAATAESLRYNTEVRRFTTPGLLATHYERGGQMEVAAAFVVQRARLFARMHLDEYALADFEHAAQLVGGVDERSRAGTSTELAARRGATEILMAKGELERARAHVKAMGVVATDAGEQALADRLRAQICRHEGDAAEAETILRAAVRAATSEGPRAFRAVAEAQIELADTLLGGARLTEGLETCTEARGLLGPDDEDLALRLDLVEADLLHSAGRFTEALAVSTRAFENATRFGSLKQCADAANDLGKVRQDMGDHERARRHYAKRLYYGRRMGAERMVGGALINLSVLSALGGDFDGARDELEEARQILLGLKDMRAVGNAEVNLAYVAIEAGDGAAAVAAARQALETLGDQSEALTGHALATLGEGLSMVGDLDAAEETLERLIASHDEQHHASVHALGLFGLAGVARKKEDPERALVLLEQALQIYQRLHHVQESARTRMRMAHALVDLRKPDQAADIAALARESIEGQPAHSDLRALEAVEAAIAACRDVAAEAPATRATALAALLREQEGA